ncbi:MAG: TIGR04255 family protein [Luteolibacter sp.]
MGSDEITWNAETFAAPIIEAIISFQCDPKPGLSMDALDSEVRKSFDTGYPNIETLKAQKFEFAFGPEIQADVQPVSGMESVEAYRLSSTDRKQLIQLRADAMHFNRLARYTSLDNYKEDIAAAWNIYREIFQPIVVNKISVRYINRIELAFRDPLQKTIELGDYFTTSPANIPGNGLALTGLFQSFSLLCPKSKAIAKTTISTEKTTECGGSLLLDIEASLNVSSPPNDFSEFEEILEILRDLKNQIFQSTLTDRCRSQYQP